MPELTRRQAFALPAVLPAWAQTGPFSRFRELPNRRLQPRSSDSIPASRLSVNFGIGHSPIASESAKRALPYVKPLGVKWARMTASWAGIEPAPATYCNGPQSLPA